VSRATHATTQPPTGPPYACPDAWPKTDRLSLVPNSSRRCCPRCAGRWDRRRGGLLRRARPPRSHARPRAGELGRPGSEGRPAAHHVFARDGCAARRRDGTSLRNLHDHHVRFRGTCARAGNEQ
jgi:hypothetical protein